MASGSRQSKLTVSIRRLGRVPRGKSGMSWPSRNSPLQPRRQEFPGRVSALSRHLGVEAGICVEPLVLHPHQVEKLERAVAPEALVVPLDHEEHRTGDAWGVSPVAIAEAPADGAGAGEPAQPPDRGLDARL